MNIDLCPFCKSEDIEDCEVTNPEHQDYHCNKCSKYFDVYNFMP